jgi:hypothetical protein
MFLKNNFSEKTILSILKKILVIRVASFFYGVYFDLILSISNKLNNLFNYMNSYLHGSFKILNVNGLRIFNDERIYFLKKHEKQE